MEPVAQDAADSFWASRIVRLFIGKFIKRRKKVVVQARYDLMALACRGTPS